MRDAGGITSVLPRHKCKDYLWLVCCASHPGSHRCMRKRHRKWKTRGLTYDARPRTHLLPEHIHLESAHVDILSNTSYCFAARAVTLYDRTVPNGVQ